MINFHQIVPFENYSYSFVTSSMESVAEKTFKLKAQ